MSEELIKHNLSFESIKHIDENNNEFWSARELMIVLGYKDWRYFNDVIEKAKIASSNSNLSPHDHFVVDNKMVRIGSGAERVQIDYILDRYACYLIAQNANPRLKTVALAQTYFAIQTRKQEITEKEYIKLSEEEKRLYNRKIVKDKNSMLFEIAKKSGVENFAKFNNAGYLGLYEETAKQIKSRKDLTTKDDILDFMDNEELGANIFRITQTDAKLKKDNINIEQKACDTHYQVSKAVRDTIKKIGGTMPENLPTPEKSIKVLEKERKKIARLEAKNIRTLK